MDLVLVAVGLVGLLVGATGTWSPCGLSMIETIGPLGHEDGRATTLAACTTFAPFAVLGGALTFASLAVLGQLAWGAGGAVALAIAAAVAVAAAVLEARGVPIVPQVRRQLPVRWRSSMPMPVAAAGYGVLLGLGFTTFILSYGVWALMGIVLVVGDPLAGLIAGIAFGIGRAVPIVVLAPIADRPVGQRACDAMAMKPGLYRGARLGDAAALLALAAALAGTAGAQAAKKTVTVGSDPSAAGTSLVYESPAGEGRLTRGGEEAVPLPGRDPATGGPWVAVIAADEVLVLDRETLAEAARVPAPGADAVAISAGWLAIRSVAGNRDRIAVMPLGEGGAPGKARSIAAAKRPAQLSRPALDGNTAVAVLSRAKKNMLVRYSLRAGKAPKKKRLLATSDYGITAPSISGRKIAYIRTQRRKQSVMVKGLGGDRGRVALRAKKGPPTLWNTAIAGKRVLVTVLRGGGGSRIISVGR